MKDSLARSTGAALLWRAIELVGVKIIFLVRLLILARLLSPDDFGLMAIAMTAIGFMLSISDFGMLPALVQRSNLNNDNYNAAWTVIVVRATAIAAIVFLAAPLIADLFDVPRAVPILRVLALRPLLEAAASIRIADLMRHMEFRALAAAKLTESLLNTIVAITLAWRFGVWSLVFGALSGAGAYLVFSYVLAPHKPRLLFDFKSVQPLIQFGRWIFVSGLIAIAGGMILKVVISRQLGAAQLGIYFLAARLAFLPTEVATKVAGHVAFPLYARLQSDISEATRAFRSMLTATAAILLPICLLIIALAPGLVQDVLGPRWEGTVTVIRLLSVVSILGILGEAAVPILKGLGQPHKVTILEIVQSSLLIIFVWGLTSRYQLSGAVLSWYPALIVSQIFSIVFMQKLLERPFLGIKAPITVIAVSSVAGALVAFIVGTIIPGLTGLVLAGAGAVLITGSLYLAFDYHLDLGFINSLGRAFPQIESFSRWKS